MSVLVSSRLRDLFLAPDEAAPVRRVAERALPATIGVLAPAREGDVAAVALAVAAARGRRSRCAVVCRWDGVTAAAPRPALAARAAGRLAARLDRRGLPAAARGRVVTVALPPAPEEARAAAERTLAAVDDLPLVVLVAGPRPSALDPLLATLDRLVVVPAPDAPPGLSDLAVTAAALLGRGVARLDLPDTPYGRLVVTTGRPLSPRLRAAATAALEGGGDA
jgi:hypothetical protein